MNNYRTNCNNRRVMPASSQCMQNYPAQRMETMQDNCRNRVCNDMQNSRDCDYNRTITGTQNCQTGDCGCNDVQNNQTSNCSCNEMQNNTQNNNCNGKPSCNCSCNETQSNHCDGKEASCEQTCTCSCTCTCSQNNQNNSCGNNNVQNEQDNHCNCSCNPSQNNHCDSMSGSSACRPEPTLCEFPIGMAYVPIQQWRRLYDICAAFRNGTLFQELNLDFLGRRCN